MRYPLQDLDEAFASAAKTYKWRLRASVAMTVCWVAFTAWRSGLGFEATRLVLAGGFLLQIGVLIGAYSTNRRVLAAFGVRERSHFASQP